MKKRNPLKGIIITVIIVAIIVGSILGAYQYNQSKKLVKVAPILDYAMTDFWGDEINSYGSITSDESQMVYLTNSQKIKEVKVAQGDYVNEGDVILLVEVEARDITGKKLDIQLAEIGLRQAQLKLEMLKSEKPVADASKIKMEEVTKIVTTGVERKYYTVAGSRYGDGLPIEANKLVATVNLSKDKSKQESYVVWDEDFATKLSAANDTLVSEVAIYNGEFANIQNGINQSKSQFDANADNPLVETTLAPFESVIFATSDYTAIDTPIQEAIVCEEKYYDVNGKYLGSNVYDDKGKCIESYDIPTGYTEEELKKAIADKEYEIKKDDLALRKMKNEYETMVNTSSNGEIKATISGTVMSLQDQESIDDSKPFLTITASDYFYIQGSIGEFNLEDVKVGDTCTVNSWETGSSTTATIVSIDDYPNTSGGYSSAGNPNASAYGFKATLDSTEGFSVGDYLDIRISPGQAQNGFYLQNFLIRKDIQGSFIMLMDDNNCLKKQYVTCGKSVWGSYTQILSEVDQSSYIAFPYGDAAEGVKCEIADSLYDY